MLSIRTKKYLIVHYGGVCLTISEEHINTEAAIDFVISKGAEYFIDSILRARELYKQNTMNLHSDLFFVITVAEDIQANRDEAITFIKKLFDANI